MYIQINIASLNDRSFDMYVFHPLWENQPYSPLE